MKDEKLETPMFGFESEEDFVAHLKQRIRASLPEPLYCEAECKEMWIPLSDGVKLFASVTMPKGSGPWPVILSRNPYKINEFFGKITGHFLAEQGFVYVLNRVRGTGKSEGEFNPFVQERKDGREVLDWVAEQSWCDGNIGMHGTSYVGHVQWCVADYKHPALKTMVIQNFGIHPYHIFYRNGMFRQDVWTEWACQMMGENMEAEPAYVQEQVNKGFQVFPQIELGKQLVGKDCLWYNQWITNISEKDLYWQGGFWKELQDSVKSIDCPMLLIGGWFDILCRSELDSWRALPAGTRAKSRYVIGPWEHTGLTAGDLEYPGNDVMGEMQLAAAVEWFNYQLKGMPYPHSIGVVEAYSIGNNEWRIWKDDILPDTEKTLFLDADGSLTVKLPDSGEVHYDYDPEHPTASISSGGNKASSFCPEVGARDGVVSFVSATLEENLYLAGQITAELYVRSSALATAFAIVVMEEFEDGKSVWITEDISDIRWEMDGSLSSYEPGTVKKLTIAMQDINWRLKKGSKLRIDISSSSYPLYHVHPNTTENWAICTERVTAKQTICCGGSVASCLKLPVLTDKDERCD